MLLTQAIFYRKGLDKWTGLAEWTGRQTPGLSSQGDGYGARASLPLRTAWQGLARHVQGLNRGGPLLGAVGYIGSFSELLMCWVGSGVWEQDGQVGLGLLGGDSAGPEP